MAKQIIEFDGDNALKLGGFKLCTSYPNNYFYNNIHVIKIIKQPILSSKLTYEDTAQFDPNRPLLHRSIKERVETEIKYEGYIRHQLDEVKRQSKVSSRRSK